MHHAGHLKRLLYLQFRGRQVPSCRLTRNGLCFILLRCLSVLGPICLQPFQRCYQDGSGGIAIVEMLFCTSLLALVGAGAAPAWTSSDS